MMTNNYDLLYDLKLMKRKSKDKRKNIIELNNINMDLTSYLLKTEDNKLIEILLLYS